MKQFLAFALFFLAISGIAQVAPSKYFIEFKDKNGTPYTISHPEQFLSARSMDRRTRLSVATTEQDLPVTPTYVSTIAGMGVTVLNRSKWLNGITIYTTDSLIVEEIKQLSFVRQVLMCGNKKRIEPGTRDKFSIEKETALPGNNFPVPERHASTGFDYGPSYKQIHQLHGDTLHMMGYRGQGEVIAVLDAGFMNADSLPIFDSLRANNQILGTRDFVLPGNNVYREFYHGTSVLSTMGGNIPGRLIGTAPKASYWLYRTEDVASENVIEEYNWVSGAETADSAGADIINSSLGYSTFNEITKWDHTWSDMNGHTTVVTRGANIAASKGIAVINSAGNEGSHTWRYITAPADGDYVLGIGAVDSLGAPASFSSHGIPGNAVKPNVDARGELAYCATPDSGFAYLSGTSFSSPIMAGMVACLWQTKPSVSVADLYEAIERSASRFSNPDTLMGYGIPDFSQSVKFLSAGDRRALMERVYPNPFTKDIFVRISSETKDELTIKIISQTGRVVFREQKILHPGSNEIHLNPDITFPGVYILNLDSGSINKNVKLIKL
jgi:serine protease AprX